MNTNRLSGRNWRIIGIAVAVIIVGVVAWYLASPLFIDRSVDEAFPFEPPSAAAIAQMSETELAEMETELEAAIPAEATLDEMPEAERQAVQDKVMEAVAAMPDKVMAEPMPAQSDVAEPPEDEMMEEATPAQPDVAEPSEDEAMTQEAEMESAAMAEPAVILNGQFDGVDSIHQGSGAATVYRLADNSRILRFEDFMVTNGPGLVVILSDNPDVHLTRGIGDYVELGKLKGNVGNQNYEIPADVDLDRHSVVVIYCKPFHVVFATATLAS